MLTEKSKLALRSLWHRMVETKENIEHEEVGKVGVLEDDVKEDIEEALEEKEVIEAATGD